MGDEQQDKEPMSYLESMTLMTEVEKKLRKQLEPQGWIINPKTGKWDNDRLGIDSHKGWIYTHIDQKRNCGLCLHIYQMFRFIPTFALDHCWKVVCTPTRVVNLFKLLQIQEQFFLPDKIPCKCGLDLREHTPHRYGGYWYCSTQEEWKQRWYQVRKLVDEHIGKEPIYNESTGKFEMKDVPVIMKRYCTEYELDTCPSGQYKQPPNAKFVEHTVKERMNHRILQYKKQPQAIKEEIKLRWLIRAWSIGDMSCMVFNDGDPFYRKLVTYHEEFEEKYLKNKEKNNAKKG